MAKESSDSNFFFNKNRLIRPMLEPCLLAAGAEVARAPMARSIGWGIIGMGARVWPA